MGRVQSEMSWKVLDRMGVNRCQSQKKAEGGMVGEQEGQGKKKRKCKN